MICKKLFVLLSLAFIYSFSGFAQLPTVEIITSGTKTSLRGLSVVNDNVVWVSGSNGMVGKSLNGGKNWNWYTVKGFEKTEFRDIEAFDGQTAIIMGIAEPAYILKTVDGGESWKVVYENKTKGMFLDAMDFAGQKYGMVIGDPINNKTFMAATTDGGDSWSETSGVFNTQPTDSGEAFFAASGSNIRLLSVSNYYLVSGGTKSSLITAHNKKKLPLLQGKESTGANSIDMYDLEKGKTGKYMCIVGGDFSNPDTIPGNCIYTTNWGGKWMKPKTPPHGYRSCVEYLSKRDLLSTGINGTDYSNDGGKTWTWISKEGFNTCRIAKTGRTVFLAGNNGKIAKMKWP